MLQKAFFKVDVVDRIYDTPVFEKTTPGAYEFTVPEEYNYVVIEYAGAVGGRRWNSDGGGIYPDGNGGGGSIKKEQIKIHSRYISGVVGVRPTQTYAQEYIGGSGYNNGGNGAKQSVTVQYISGGGGGGSTSVVVNNVIKEASGGGGASWYTGAPMNSKAYGGKGGGQYGGAELYSYGDGNNATDPNQIGLNSGNGYVKIWAGYDPYFKG